MNVVQFIKSKMQARPNMANGSDEQDLFLYRQLRRAENELHEARGCLRAMLASQEQTDAGHAIIAQAGDEPECKFAAVGDQDRTGGGMQQLQEALSRPQSRALERNGLAQEIERMKNDVIRLEAEYQHAQMNVRTYFYLESCPGRLPEGELTPGHSAQ